MDLTRLFAAHIATLQKALEDALAATGHPAVVISSGAPSAYFADDQDVPFRPTPHFAWWCPLRGPHHALRLAPGEKPLLARYAPEDYWYEQSGLGDPYWLASFELVEARSLEDLWKAVSPPRRSAYIGNEPARAEELGLEPNPRALTARLDWARSYKTDYEVACVAEATVSGARGHEAARSAFAEGASEMEIHHAFVAAVGATDEALAYPTIIALNEKAATLHYEGKRTDVRHGKVLLIDAGTRAHGYACDITRTHVGSHCDPRFLALLEGMERLQQELCAAVTPGSPFLDLHLTAHRKVAGLLKDGGILRADPEEALERGLSRPFFPHGLGHHLGIQVHDVGGHQSDPAGTLAPPPSEHPFLRNTRTMEPGQVFTIEPGLYFNPLLLRPFRAGSSKDRFDWERIDALMPFGGIRVEDNVLVTERGHRNLTREKLP